LDGTAVHVLKNTSDGIAEKHAHLTITLQILSVADELTSNHISNTQRHHNVCPLDPHL
jgi:hypothetical protein